MNSDHTLDKRQVRHAFDRAAISYDAAAVLQREICDRMLSRLEYIKFKPESILDAGSGTGYGHYKLKDSYPSSKLIAIDIALKMHLQARPTVAKWKQWLPTLGKQVQYVCGDIEQLPLSEKCVDLVWSNLALQWCNNLEHTFAEIYRVLRGNGLFMFSTFGPDTLKELRQAFSCIDGYSHVNHFIDMHDVGDLLLHNGFSTPVMDMEYLTLTYNDVIDIMRDLKSIGANNATQGRRSGLMGKNAWQNVIAQYEKLRKDGKLPATYEVVYGHAWKPMRKESVLTPETRRQIGLGL